MDEFEEMELTQVDTKGYDSHDRHYFGLVRSVVIGVRRMIKWCDGSDAQAGTKDTKKLAIGLLMAMSMLDRTKTPTSLFTATDSSTGGSLRLAMRVYLKVNKDTDASILDRQAKAFDEAMRPFFSHREHFGSQSFAPLFTTPGQQHRGFARAQEVLELHGFLLPNTNNSECVGAIHQLVQRAVREHLMAPDTPDIPKTWTKGLLDTVEAVLKSQAQTRVGDDLSSLRSFPSNMRRLRRLRPTMEHWCNCLCKTTVKHLKGYETGAHDLLETLGDIMFLDGEFKAAHEFTSTVLEFRKKESDTNTRKTIKAMYWLGRICSALGEKEKAVELQEEALEISKRDIPDDYRLIGKVMHYLGYTYYELGRLKEASRLQRSTLKVLKTVLPKNSVTIAVTMADLASTYSRLGKLHKSLELRKQCLEIYKSTLPEDHPRLAIGMNDLAVTYSQLDRLDDAIKLQRGSVQILKSVMVEGHPWTGIAMLTLAHMNYKNGQIQDALSLMKELLAIRKRLLPADHKDIGYTTKLVIFLQSQMDRCESDSCFES